MNFQNLNNNLEFKIIISLYLKFKEKSQISSNTYFQTFQNKILLFQVISFEKWYFSQKNTILLFIPKNYRDHSIISNYFWND
jgi:hypothetical protein